jgi:hypothetical protein
MTPMINIVSLDHVWPGAENATLDRAAAGDERATYVAVFLIDVVDDPAIYSICLGCDLPLQAPADIACLTVAHVWMAPGAQHVAIPFCVTCAKSRESVSRLARIAVAQFLEALNQDRTP